jgi:hypothetical protein
MNSFNESQRFKQWWLWTILIGALLIPIGITVWEMTHGNAKYDLTVILYGAGLPAAIVFLFIFFKLDSKLDGEGIHYRFFPLQVAMKKITWSEVSRAYVRKYSPLAEYGGWGIRFGMKGTGMAYNIAGNMGLQLELKTGKKILIGTQMPDQMKEQLVDLVRNKIIDRTVINP